MVGAVTYIRVSTKEQTENLSLSTQRKACEEYCQRQGFEVLARFREEGESAKTADRTELQKLLHYCRLHKGRVQFVVVFNLTRFAREKYDHFALRAHLKSLGISLRSATEPIDDTSTGKLMEGVLAAFAQFDNDVRSDRTRAGMKAALELGRWTFLAPLGYMNAPRAMGKSMILDPERAPLVRRAFQDFATGRFTKQEVRNNVTALGPREGSRASRLARNEGGRQAAGYRGRAEAEGDPRKLDRLDEAFLYERTIDIERYDRQRDKLREELTLVQMDRHATELDELDVEGILAFARSTERVEPVGAVVAESEAAAAAVVFS
jgi:DNA invertase Pin-like site-specific DNA recombinase